MIPITYFTQKLSTLLKPSKEVNTTEQSIEKAEPKQTTKTAGIKKDPNLLQDALYYYNTLKHGVFNKSSFVGTEDEARKLGYETYRKPTSLKRHSVNYPVTVDESADKTDIAKAQFDKYGISQDYARDKSTYDKLMYQYLPGYGYNPVSFIENIVRNKKVADATTGDRVILGKQRPNKSDIWAQDANNNSPLHKIYVSVNNPSEIDYSTHDASKARIDYRNLHWGYPQKNGTLTVNTNIRTKNNGESFQGDYAFKPSDSKSILSKAKKLPNGQTEYISGHQLGNFAIGKTKEGKAWFYDDWDLFGHLGSKLLGGRSFDVYDRIE